MNRLILSKVLSTGVSFLVTFFVGIIVPRVVGPEEYGGYAYIVATYLFLFQLFLMGSNTAYVYFLSGQKYSRDLVNGFFLALYVGVVLSVLLVGIGARYLFDGLLWKGQFDYEFIIVGYVFCLMTNLQLRLIEYADSTEYTVGFEVLRLGAKIALLVSLLLMAFWGVLNIDSFLWVQIFSLSVFFCAVASCYRGDISFSWPKGSGALFSDVFQYVKPMIAFTVVAAFYSYMGKFLLQSYGGSEAQGVYQACLQLVLIPVAFLTSLTSIFLKKMVSLYERGMVEELADYFSVWVLRLFLVHAPFSFFLIFYPEQVIALVFGQAYMGGAEVIKYLALFSLLHVFGLLSANLFYCSARNRLYSIINGLVMAVGLVGMLLYAEYFSFSAEILAVMVALLYGLRVALQVLVNAKFFTLNIGHLLLRLLVVTLVYGVIFFLVQVASGNILLVFLFSFAALFMVNFMMGDVLRVRHLLGSILSRF